MGAHNFKMGYEFLRYHQNANNGPGNVDGSFTYAGVGGLQSQRQRHRQYGWHHHWRSS